MNEQRLLERIRLADLDPDRRDVSDPVQVVNSILGHLRMILNTRQGNAQIAPDFGVPDFTSMVGTSGLDAIRDIEASMTEVVLKYEPRLQGVKIEFLPDEEQPLSLIFKLQARLALEDREMPMVFETVLNPDGQIMIKDS